MSGAIYEAIRNDQAWYRFRYRYLVALVFLFFTAARWLVCVVSRPAIIYHCSVDGVVGGGPIQRAIA